jgi:hypothetical protein
MTRPSQRSDGRTALAAEVTTARQPRRTPQGMAAVESNHLTGDRPRGGRFDGQPRANRDRLDRAPAISTISPRTPTTRLGDLLSQSLHDLAFTARPAPQTEARAVNSPLGLPP